jgi:hypothetical protein
MCFFSKTQIAHLIEFNGAAFFDLRGEMCSLLNNPLTLTVNFNHVEVPKLKNVLIVDLFPRENFSFPGPFGACPGPNKKKRKNWDNFLPKGRPCPLAQSAVIYFNLAIISDQGY